MGTCSSCFVLVSIGSAGASCIGFYLPYWIKGVISGPNEPSPLKTFFSTFRRCNFPQLSADQTDIVIERECGRYSSFSDIPSVWWQLATLVVGFGSALTLFAAVMSFLACWINDMWTRLFIRGLGLLHLGAGLLITLGLLLHPLGWDAPEVTQACVSSSKYHLGSCHLYWCYFILIAAVTGELLLFITSLKMEPLVASRSNYKERYAEYEYAQDV
ncbi:putative Lipoma HMGIC fusion partner-like protein [Hypsibius exemplaris]|uniref:Lipoma HMGIC fusion partner-like protein n=1 Tax=Hypsibius exemplaris TaxID=2072580 RepID=A0A9X6NJ41_HYPEX|nr:putative Lipoma HMGIC fusion partner-like protein [Hypsibius exemplaris]